MLEVLKQLVDKKSVLILGFGREGKSTLKTLLKVKNYKKIAIADKNNIELDKEYSNVEVELISGDAYLEVLNDFDVVFKSPGIVLDKDISEYKCEIVSQTEIFFRRYREQIVGITGTKGKSTVTTLIAHILKKAGIEMVLAGNIGIPVFEVADDMDKDTTAVIELSCHQLEYMTVSPHIGVLLNIYEEHLDHYGTVEKYIASKRKIYQNQLDADLLICNVDNIPKERKCEIVSVKLGEDSTNLDADIVVKDKIIESNKYVYEIPVDEIQLLGEHNYYNIAIAYEVCKRLGVDRETFDGALKIYQTLPHRLQYIGTYDGVKYYDDSISTASETTIQALKSLKDTNTVIIGGMDRGINYEKLEAFLNLSQVEHIILMETTGKRILEEIKENIKDFIKPERLIYVEHLEDAVKKAKQITEKGKSCVMSPAAASYGIFKNFEDRGEHFAMYVKNSK